MKVGRWERGGESENFGGGFEGLFVKSGTKPLKFGFVFARIGNLLMVLAKPL